MAQYPPPGPPQYPEGQGYPPPPPGYGQPPQGYGPPPGQYSGPPPYGDAQAPPVKQGRGCRGCLFGCLAAFLVVCVLSVVVGAVGVFMFRQAFPTSESFGEATMCAGLRIGITVIEAGLTDSEMSADERAAAQQMLREARTEFENNCGAQR